MVDPNTFPASPTPPAPPARATSTGAALNWYLGRNARFNLDFERTWFVAGAPSGQDRPTENALLARVQVTF